MANVAELANKTFDYVIVGGGTAGLTLAGRLVENPDITVAVLEAGPANLDDPVITVPGQFGRHFGDPKYDWNFTTEPQEHSNNKTYGWPRGKTLGGSSAINFYVWSKPPSRDVDAWEKLGNPGWNWKRYQEYSNKTESFSPQREELSERYKQKTEAESHGYTGGLKTSFPPLTWAGEVPHQETMHNLGVLTAKDPFGGDPMGTFMPALNLDPKTHTRAYAVTASYTPNKDKPNFTVLTDALVHRLVTEGLDGNLVATGVEFEHGKDTHVVHAKKEVILCAGALKTPQVLELSGIGEKDRLKVLGIEAKIHLPGVGENAQEHTICRVDYELDPEKSSSYETLDALRDEEHSAQQIKLGSEQTGLFRLGLGSFTFLPFQKFTASPSVAKTLISEQRARVEANAASYPPGLKEQYELQLETLESESGADCEIVCATGFKASGPKKDSPDDPAYVSVGGSAYMSVVGAINHPFARGTVHIKSADPHVQPTMDPHYFEEEFDLKLFTELIKFIRRLPETEPFKSMVVKEVAPGPNIIIDDDVKDYIKNNMSTTFHTAGTATMMPRDKNGVVDVELKVYGTKNVRVIDLSIVPLHVAAHTQATVYAIAEAGADILLGKL